MNPTASREGPRRRRGHPAPRAPSNPAVPTPAWAQPRGRAVPPPEAVTVTGRPGGRPRAGSRGRSLCPAVRTLGQLAAPAAQAGPSSPPASVHINACPWERFCGAWCQREGTGASASEKPRSRSTAKQQLPNRTPGGRTTRRRGSGAQGSRERGRGSAASRPACAGFTSEGFETTRYRSCKVLLSNCVVLGLRKTSHLAFVDVKCILTSQGSV